MVWKIVQDFKKFTLRGNMLDLAIGFTVGAAFTTVVKSFVSDILMPPIGLLTGRFLKADMQAWEQLRKPVRSR